MKTSSDDRFHPYAGATMQSNERWISGEPSLDEMLADPIVRILMAYDGLSEESVRDAFALAAERLRARSDGMTEAA